MRIKTMMNGIAATALLVGCSAKTDSLEGYMDHYSKDHPVSIETRSLRYDFNIVPGQFIALRDAGYAHGKFDAAVAAERMRDLTGKTFLKLKIVNTASARSPLQHNLSGPEELQQRVEYYSFAAERDLKCLCGTDTLYPLDYSFEENYNLSDYAVINAVFDSCRQKQFSVLFDDRAADQLALKASFDQTLFPKLKINLSHE